MSDNLLLRHSQVFNQRMTFLRASRLSFAPFFGTAEQGSSRICVELQEESVTAGQILNGAIFIELKNVLTFCDLTVASTGLEELRVYNSFRLSSEKSGKIFSFSAKIRYWKELAPGNYKIPFTLKIPKFCPATFYYSDEDHDKNYIKSSISYFLTCILTTKETELCQHTHLIVKSQKSLIPCFEELEKKGEIRSCLCWTSGHSVFFIQPKSKQNISVNGTFEYKLLINNFDCSKPVNSICSQIVRVLKFRSNRQEFKVKNILSRIHRKVDVPAKSGIFDSPDFLFNHDLKMGSEDFNTSSTEGKVIICQFFLEVFVFYTGKFKNRPFVLLVDLHVNPDIGVLESCQLPVVYQEEPPVNLLIED